MKNRQLAGICGLYCGNCVIYRAFHDNDSEVISGIACSLGIGKEEVRCCGCRSDSGDCWTHDCEFKACSAKKGIDSCGFCDEFPCKLVMGFNADSIPQHHKALGNLKKIKANGIDAWLADEEKSWSCPSCGHAFSYFDKHCRHCGSEL